MNTSKIFIRMFILLAIISQPLCAVPTCIRFVTPSIENPEAEFTVSYEVAQVSEVIRTVFGDEWGSARSRDGSLSGY